MFGHDHTKILYFSASCDYWRYGPGGRQENINAICILNLNIINDKVIDICTLLYDKIYIIHWALSKVIGLITQVFLLLWWWFYLIGLLSLVRVVYRGVQCRQVE